MTCIVALVDDNGMAHFAGDSLVVQVPGAHHSGVSQTVRREPKVWVREKMLFGANGAVRMLQLLRYSLDIPQYRAGQDKVTYLVTQFIPALQACLEANKYFNEALGGNILLALEGELFTIGNQFQVCNTADHYDAVGKASEVAIGSLYTTQRMELPPRERLLLALKAAERHTCVVSAPFYYISGALEQAEVLS